MEGTGWCVVILRIRRSDGGRIGFENIEKGRLYMKKALIFMANGFEEIEAITLVDILRRADVHVDMCSIHDRLEVKGAHGIEVKADLLSSGIRDANAYDVILIPGGIPGATNLRDNEFVIDTVKAFYEKAGKWIASICAAPIVLGRAGIASGIAGTCYPGYESQVGYRSYAKEAVVCDKNVITSMGPGTAFDLALKLVERLLGADKAKSLYDGTLLAYSKFS